MPPKRMTARKSTYKKLVMARKSTHLKKPEFAKPKSTTEADKLAPGSSTAAPAPPSSAPSKSDQVIITVYSCISLSLTKIL